MGLLFKMSAKANKLLLKGNSLQSQKECKVLSYTHSFICYMVECYVIKWIDKLLLAFNQGGCTALCENKLQVNLKTSLKDKSLANSVVFLVHVYN
jgi:hypothetical protein